MSKKPSPKSAAAIWPGLFFTGTLLWLLLWIFHFGTTLINDEYQAIDYFYRSVKTGGLYPTPDAFQKPLSVLLGFFPWLFESALAYEITTALFACLLVVLFFLIAKEELGNPGGIIAALAVAFHPDLMYYTARGSTVVPYCALSFIALRAARRRQENRHSLWIYAGALFVAGLIRTEPWIMALGCLLWWRPPPGEGWKGWVKPLAAASLVGMAPIIWLGKDYFINGSVLHGFKVAAKVQVVGLGEPFTLPEAFLAFISKISNKVGWPVFAGGLLGAFLYVKERGWPRGLLEPLVMFPLLTSLFLLAVIRGGVYPNPWYFYFDSLFAVLFCGIFVKFLAERVKSELPAIAASVIFFASLITGLAALKIHGISPREDGFWLLLGSSLLPLSVAVLVAEGGRMWRDKKSALILGVITFISLFYLAFAVNLGVKEVRELSLEAEKQREMIAVADYLRARIPPGRGDRIMMPSRRNEQLSWLFRDREIPETVALREALYLKIFKGIDFLDLHPDWLIYIPRDYQFHGPDDMFKWLGTLDRTVLRGVEISLVMETKHIRVFKLTYPPDFPPKSRLPEIP